MALLLMTMTKMLMIMTTMMFASIVYLAHLAEAEFPSVTYVNSTNGEFFIVSGYVIDEEHANLTLQEEMICRCQFVCDGYDWCASWSTHLSSNETRECRLTDANPPFAHLNPHKGSIYKFFPGSNDGRYKMEADDLLYLYPDETKNYTDAKSFCAAIPGHRLAIFKTMIQWEILLSYYGDDSSPYLLVDLVWNGNEDIWGDGTPHSETEIYDHHRPINDQGNTIYVVYQRMLDDYLPGEPVRFLCQANPNGVNW